MQRPDTSESGHPNEDEVLESQLDNRLKHMAHLPIRELMREVLHLRWLTSQHRCENGGG